ncbi:hypothetical protein PHISCL_06681 [Aspergillus sclerotialis]|uniref:Flo11 n=1 Tax=Aspergillus sclerotialis TaxID=2070753 RepID=A0A3A2ZVB7_9EURO|nr:hypothetical protein PHISCL_06681 [Aspergillus sclerotialis]
MAAGPRSRSTSMSSDSQLPRLSVLSPPLVNPKPAFIASSAASQIITTDQEFNTADFVAEEGHNGTAGSALVTPAALAALNGFLDHLLFHILAAAKSTRLACIRPAVAEVLKPRLAREVVSAADDELSDYIGEDEDEQFEFRSGQEPGGEFDLIRSWKLTRLRCMVYTRLGDMEEDDEDEYIARDGLGENDGAPRRFTSHVGNITPAAAIFLTSIIEYIGEQALIIAGETARSRLATNVPDHDEVTESGAERSSMNRLVVEDLDVEKLALNSTLGRLWRTWRKCVRAQTLGRAVSRESFRRPGSAQPIPSSRKSSMATADEITPRSVSAPATEEEEVDPASIPLPTTEHDVQEIEIPGFSTELDGEIQTLEAVVAHKMRPRSLMVFSHPSHSPRSPSSTASSPAVSPSSQSPKLNRHGRSKSLPNASYFPDRPWGEEQTDARVVDEASPTVSDENKRLETMYEHDEQTDPMRPGLAISSDQQVPKECAGEPNEKEIDSSSGVGNEPSAEQNSYSAASMEVITSQPSSVRTSAVGDDKQQQEAEVIEGQGMCEKPKPMVQRPKRKSSRDPTQEEESQAETSERAMPPVSEDQPPKQGDPVEESTNSGDASRPGDTSDSVATPFVPPNRHSNDESTPSKTAPELANVSEKARPPSASTSGDSERSEHSRTKAKPSPLILSTGSTHGYPRSTLSASSGIERASVQRISGRPSTSTTHSNPRRSDSFTSAREKRPVTSGSSTSQVSNKLKGLIGRPGDSASARFRSSSETSRASGGSGDSDNLEKLIKSDETLHFTLTPKSMREMEEPDSPRWRAASLLDTEDHPESVKGIGISGHEPQGHAGQNPARKTVDFAAMSKSKSTEFPKAKPAERMSLPPKQRTVQARDARLTNESTRDFAEFIKSTGPPVPASPGRPDIGSPKSSGATETSRNSRPAGALSKNAGSARGNFPKLEARPAAGVSGNHTSDLIDFIREGPPTPGAHRIPRAVAPFRDTTDSEDFESSEAERTDRDGPTRASLASTQGSSMAKSFTSVGSRTGLLDSTRRTTIQAGPNTQVSAPSPAPSRNVSDEPVPARKQRRVRDPYAIDSDDEDDHDDLTSSKPKREEESLMDFLRNVPPPSTQPAPQPFNISRNPATIPAKSPLRQHSGNSPGGQSNYALKVGMERNGGSMNVPSTMPGRQTETSALADFLKNTGPPEPPAPRTPTAGVGKKESGVNSISRLFTRRKKIEA